MLNLDATTTRDATVTFSALSCNVHLPVPVERGITQYLQPGTYRPIIVPLTDEESKTFVTVTSKDGGKFAVLSALPGFRPSRTSS